VVKKRKRKKVEITPAAERTFARYMKGELANGRILPTLKYIVDSLSRLTTGAEHQLKMAVVALVRGNVSEAISYLEGMEE
jgi:hypothetical protein